MKLNNIYNSEIGKRTFDLAYGILNCQQSGIRSDSFHELVERKYKELYIDMLAKRDALLLIRKK